MVNPAPHTKFLTLPICDVDDDISITEFTPFGLECLKELIDIHIDLHPSSHQSSYAAALVKMGCAH